MQQWNVPKTVNGEEERGGVSNIAAQVQEGRRRTLEMLPFGGKDDDSDGERAFV